MFQDFLRQVREIDDRIRRTGSVTWYRGHRQSDWRLVSTLHRYIERLTLDVADVAPEEKRSLLRDEGKTLYRRFKAEAWPLLRSSERSDWGVIFSMQHYRLPTRLLDWTESFACALFFAQLHRQPGDAAALWVRDSAGLNAVSLGIEGLVALDEHVGCGRIDVREWHPRWPAPPHDLVTIAESPISTNPRRPLSVLRSHWPATVFCL